MFSIEYVLYKIIFDALTGKQIQEVLNACQGWGGLHTHIQIHIHEHTRIHAHTHTQVHTYIRTGIRTIAELFFLFHYGEKEKKYAYIRTGIRTYKNTHTHTHTHTRTCVCMHMQVVCTRVCVPMCSYVFIMYAYACGLHTHTHTSSIDMYNNDVGQESAQKFMKQTGDLKAATLYFAS